MNFVVSKSTITNVMIDIETLGTRPGCKILSIGAVVFTPEGVTDEQIYIPINRSNQGPLKEDGKTLAWWNSQSKEAVGDLLDEEYSDSKSDVKSAIMMLAEWLNSLDMDKPLVWGNGSDFDNVIINESARLLEVAEPIAGFRSRCYRTLKDTNSKIKFDSRTGVHHNALDDAISQAKHAVQILNAIDGWSTRQKRFTKYK